MQYGGGVVITGGTPSFSRSDDGRVVAIREGATDVVVPLLPFAGWYGTVKAEALQ
jgi:hypothetical protein